MRVDSSTLGSRRFRLLLASFSLAGALAVGASARADDPAALRLQEQRLEGQSSSIGAQSASALLELYALESALARSERRLDGLRARLGAVEREQAEAHSALQIARKTQAAAQKQLAARLTALYVDGDTDPLEVLLGASSLDDVLSTVDGLQRLAEEDERIARQAGTARASLGSALERLHARELEARRLVAGAEAARSSLATARDEKASYLVGLSRRQRLTRDQITSLASRATEAEQRSELIEASAGATTTPEPASLAPAVPSDAPRAETAIGGRTLTVDAVAYSLPGHTASGLPVHKGVVAVDPTVIPLGTRLYVPGYGPAIAADVGTAIKGNIIDLWFPTYDQAAAWGRHTLTITIEG